MCISATHAALCHAVRCESNATTAQHVIKALMALVVEILNFFFCLLIVYRKYTRAMTVENFSQAHAPYRRLRRGPLGESVAAMRSILGSKEGSDVQLRTGEVSQISEFCHENRR
jgi:hypothetical protein